MKRGFTVVELMVVIVVIGILATIVVLAYRGHRDDVNDSARRMAVQQLESAIDNLKIQKNITYIGGYSLDATNVPDSNGLCTYSGGGWLYSEISTYPCSVGKMLLLAGLVSTDFFAKIPPNEEITASMNKSEAATMLYRCDTANSRYLLYYYLKNPTTQDTENMTTLRAGCPNNGITEAQLASYKMKAAVEIKI